MIHEETTLDDPHGVEIFYRRWLPDADPRAIVLVLHGMSEHSGRYGRFAEALVGADLAVYALDHRGFGRTSAITGPGKTGPGGFDGVLGAIRSLHEQAVADLGDIPVIVFGHSMGSMFVQAYVERHHDFAGFILCGTSGPSDELGDMVEGLKAVVEAGAGDEPLDALGAFNEPFEPARTPYDWLSRDEAEVDAYIADPMCGDGNPVTAGFVAGLLDLVFTAGQPEALASITTDTPVLLVTGEADPVSNGAVNVRQLEQAYRDTELAVTAHYYPEARHEILNETNRDEVTADIVAWIDGLLSSR